MRPKQTAVPANEDGSPEKAQRWTQGPSFGTSSEFPHQMHTLHTAPAKEDGAPDEATRDGLEVPLLAPPLLLLPLTLLVLKGAADGPSV